MSSWTIVLAVLAGANPARLAPALPRGDRGTAERALVAALGAAVAGVALGALAISGDAIADLLDVSAPTIAVAAGLVLVMAAIAQAIAESPDPEPALSGRGAALVPVAVPFVLRPEVGLVAIAAGAADLTSSALVALAATVALVAVSAAASVDGAAARPWSWAGRVGEAVAVLAGVALLVDGVLSV